MTLFFAIGKVLHADYFDFKGQKVTAQAQASPWARWQAACAAIAAGQPLPASVIDKPDQGYYRVRRKDRTIAPIAFWYAGETLVCKLGDEALPEADARKVWNTACKNPIATVAYKAAMAGPRPFRWPDMDETVADQIDEGGERQLMGGNNPPTDPTELLKEQAESVLRGIADYKTIGDDDNVKSAQTLRARLQEVARDIEKKHEAEKAPHWEKCKEIDGKWLPLKKKLDAGALDVRKAMEAYETKKANEAAAALEAKAKVARDAQAALDRQAADAKAAADAAGAPPPPPAPRVEVPVAPAPDTQIRGAVGTAASVGFVNVVDEAKPLDVLTLCTFFCDRRDLREWVIKTSNDWMKAGNTPPPGITTKRVAKIR